MAVGTGYSKRYRNLTGGSGSGGGNYKGNIDPYNRQQAQMQNAAIQNAAPTGNKLVYRNGRVVEKTAKTSDPYIKNANQTRGDLYGAYNQQYQGLRNQLNFANQNTNNTYNGLARNIYNAYMNSARQRKQLASNLGMTGGAVENLMVGNENNYNSNYGQSEGLRTRALAENQANFDTNANNALVDYNKSVADLYREARDSSLAAKETERARKLDVYQNTVARFDTEKKCKNEIKKLKKSNDVNKALKIRMVQAQLANVRAMKKGQEAVGIK